MAKVLKGMLEAAGPHLVKGGKKAADFAAHEFQQYVTAVIHVQQMADEKKITDQEAQFLVDQHKLSMRTVLLAVEGLGLIAVQNAINAALEVLKKALEAALGAALKGLSFGI